jgi:hypothetical protein
MNIVRSSRCRQGGFKYLMKRWTLQEDTMPNKSVLVVNALLASLEDGEVMTKRVALDFLSTHCPIDGSIFL